MNDRPRILLASDLTARSDRPFDRAVLLARETGGSIILVHVVEDDETLRDEAAFEATHERTLADLPDTGLPIQLVLARGSAPSTIAEEARLRDCDLIVVGAARFNSISDYFLGTAVDHLVRHATVPVLVVKRRPTRPYRNILIATDFSSSSIEAARVAATMFPETPLHLIHGYRGAYESRLDPDRTREEARIKAEQEMAEYLASPSLADLHERLIPRLGAGPLTSVIHQAIDELAIDLLVLGAYGLGAITHAAFGSRASDLLSSVRCDALLVREPR